MIIREFVVLIASKFDPKGFKQADAAADALSDATAKAEKSTRKLGDEQATAAEKAEKNAAANKAAATATKQAGTAARDASGRFVGAGRAVSGTGSRFAGFARRATESAKTMRSVASSASALAGPLTVAGAGLAALVTASTIGAGAIINQGATFEGLRTQLTTLYGDAGDAEKAFAGIREFAKRTPFEVEELTEAFIALKTRGVNPTEDALTGLGDLASSRGRNIKDIVDAVSAAARGELDPLEGFIDGARVSGDKLALTFRGQTVEVEKNAAAVTKQLVAFGQLKGVQGGMDAQSRTTAGVISNLKDGIANFFDEVAQLGVLDEFKGLLKDLSNVGGDGQGGLAKILADSLIVVLKALREAIQSVSAEDIKGFFESARTVAGALADAIGLAVDAGRSFIDMSGGVENALANMTLAIIALSTAFTGPAGAVVAAAAAGVAIGNFLNELGAADALTNFLGDLTGLNKELAKLGEANKRGQVRGQATKEQVEKSNQIRGAFGAQERGFVEDISQEEFVQIQGRAAGERGLASIETLTKIASGEVTDAVIDQGQATKILEQALAEDIEKNREASVRRGEQTAMEIESAKPRKSGKGKKAPVDPFDFSVKVDQAAKQQAADFATQEFERFRFQGMAVEDALAASRIAGKQREGELRKLFLDAGRIYDSNAKGILDILGLRGPGSVLEGRPPPQTLIITISPVITFIKDFAQTNNFQNAGATLTAATAAGGQAAVEAGLEPFKAQVTALIESMFSLQGDRLIKAGASGTLPQGPEA